VFPGRVETLKGIGQAIEICMLLHAKGIPFRLDIVGDGPERGSFEEIVIKKELDKYLIFHGWQSKTTLYKYHAQAHFILLPTSASEGWPKVLSEGMAYGVVPLAGAVSSIPQILKECKTGMALDPLNPQAFVDAILSYIHEPERWKRESVAAIQAAPRFTYEAYLEQLKIMFADYWDLKL
jgi:glycosyltransferase involved in cell wall biosynthesis